MTKILATILAALLFVSTSTMAQTDEDQIKEVINKAYIEGIHNLGPIGEIDKGFHPCFTLIGLQENGTTVSLLPIYTWRENTRVAGERNPGGAPVKTECRYKMIDVTGAAAIAKIELYREGKLIFTDYLNLYRFKDGWKIVGKIYHRH
jgi:hypothetical protein